MDPKIIGLLGTALSAIIAALSYWAKTKHERRRATRAVLYYLLEVEHLVRKIHYARNLPNDCVDEMRRTLEINGLVLTESDAEAAVEEIGQFLHVFATAEFQNLAATIAEPFEKALVELSREDPFLAFTLRGRDQLVMLPQKLADITASIRPSDVPVPEVTFNQQSSPFDSFIRQATLAELDAAILATAWRCDVITHLRVRLLLRRTKREWDSGGFKKSIAELTNELLKNLMPKMKALAEGDLS